MPDYMMTEATNETLFVYPKSLVDGVVTIATRIDGLKTVSLFSADGTKVKQILFSGFAADLRTRDLAPGTYYIMLEKKGEQAGVKILVVE